MRGDGRSTEPARAVELTVLRGLHYQVRQPQEKPGQVLAGEVFDVALDLRKSSSTFGTWVAINLSAENKRMLWIPPGFAHGFLVLWEFAEFPYKRSILLNDPDLGII